MYSMYFDSRMNRGTVGEGSKLLQLYQQEGLKAVVSTLHRGMQDAHAYMLAGTGAKQGLIQTPKKERFFQGPSLGLGKRQPVLNTTANASMGNLLTAARRPQMNTAVRSADHLSLYSQLSSDKGKSLLELEPILMELEAAADRLLVSRRQSFGEKLIYRSEMALEVTVRDGGRDSDDDSEDDSELGDLPPPPLQKKYLAEMWLVQAGTFLFMCNLFVVAPTSSQLAHMLGETPSFSGLLIGLSPLAAMGSAFAYSAWSNYSYKRPFTACTLCLIFGNLFYGMSLQCGR
jgi:hypothetical protein